MKELAKTQHEAKKKLSTILALLKNPIEPEGT